MISDKGTRLALVVASMWLQFSAYAYSMVVHPEWTAAEALWKLWPVWFVVVLALLVVGVSIALDRNSDH